jgi:hypothetical protein
MTTTEVPAQRRQREAISQIQAGAPALVLGRGDWLNSLLVFAAAALALLLADVAALRLHSGAYVVAIGNYRDKPFLERANYQETAPDGTTYRWTTGDSTLRLNQVGVARRAFLTLDLGGRPEPAVLRLTLNDQPWGSVTAAAQPRRYILLLPPDPPADLVIGLRSPTFSVPGDSRKLGVKVEGFTLTLARTAAPLPMPAQYLAQLAIVLAIQLAAARLGWRARAQALVALALALALAALLSGELLLAFAYLPRLAGSALALAALTWLLLPLAERMATPAATYEGAPYEDVGEMRVLWALMLGACAIRLVGVMEPTFAGQDLGLNLGRLFKTIVGQMVVIAGSSEFANGQTIYPPGPYLAALPGAVVIGDYGSLLQAILAILDGATAFLIALLARRLGGNRTAARFALLLYASSIPAFAALQFGFAAQIFGQWFTAPLALLLVASPRAPRPRTWVLATVLLLLGMFSHIGVAILGITWMGLTLLLTLPRARSSAMWGMALMTIGGLLALSLLYIDIAAFTLSHAAGTVAERSGAGLPGATPLLLKGALLAYSEVGLALLPLGLALIYRGAYPHYLSDDRPFASAAPELVEGQGRRPTTHGRREAEQRAGEIRNTRYGPPSFVHRRQGGWGRRVVPLALLLTALLFFVVDLALAVQVRYFYFALPLALAAIAIVLGRIAARGRWARATAWALVLVLLLQGAAAWFTAAFGTVEISMTPLTH